MSDQLPRELKKGLIELSILGILFKGRKYGLEIIKELDLLSHGFLKIKEGTLYPALHRMEERGLIESEWEIIEKGVPRRYYKLTNKGIKKFLEGRNIWKILVESINNILGEEDE